MGVFLNSFSCNLPLCRRRGCGCAAVPGVAPSLPPFELGPEGAPFRLPYAIPHV
jgi:hypothetical protein